MNAAAALQLLPQLIGKMRSKRSQQQQQASNSFLCHGWIHPLQLTSHGIAELHEL